MRFMIGLLIILGFMVKANAQGIYIDHVIKVVNNLDSAVQYYKEEGFTIKPGRLHANGLLNAHIKFSNGSSLELMSLVGEPKDQLAQTYKNILSEGEGGAFVCLSGIDIDKLKNLLNKKGYDFIISKGKAWSYISFPENTVLRSFFFIDYHYEMKKEPEMYKHSNGCNGFKSVYVHGNDSVCQFMSDIGLLQINTNNSEFKTSTGNIIIGKDGDPADRVSNIVLKK
ncbi:VOC family protein [Carboxylicivirga sp. RSCT41]|uniref:VOC family protein n=1 Tax=Carboxylicivirga agarovorans TaxID=3417570 RepID=UPI003D342704